METVTTQQFIDFIPYITVPALALTVLSFVLAITRRAGDTGAIEQRDAWHIRALVVVWAAWGFASAALSLSGTYASESFYALLPGLWMPLVPALIFALYFAVSRGPRDALAKVIDATPLHWLVYLHALRISAVGTAFETARGKFPESFELAVGVPDLLFGLSALYVGGRVHEGSIDRRGVAAWSLAGAALIVPSAPLIAQMGLPGPLMLFSTPPTATALFEYPMVLAPTLIVPLFVLFNLLTAQRLWGAVQREAETGGQASSVDAPVVAPLARFSHHVGRTAAPR